MQKPRILLDIKTPRLNTFSRRSSRIPLQTTVTTLVLRAPLKIIFCSAIFLYFVVTFAVAPNYSYSQTTSNPIERQQLEAQLSQLEQQIADYDNTIAGYKKQGTTLSTEIKKLQTEISKRNAQIAAITSSLKLLDQEITDNEGQITVTQSKLDLNRDAISRSLQYVYQSEHESLMSVLLKNPNLSDFFSDINNLLDVQTSLSVAVAQMNVLKDQLLSEKDDLAAKKSDAISFKAYQDAQKAAVAATKKQKDDLLTVTKGQESKYQTLVKETRKTAAQIRNQIFELLGGGQLSFEDAYKFAKFAEDATGVHASIILAVLDRESALGQNVGKCNYKTAMSPGIPPRAGRRDDIAPFLQITSELGINPDSITVSCAIVSDGAFGGAMGPAQFIPTTWMLYRNRIAAITDSAPASPWRNSDAFVGTALYLKDAMSACTGPTYGSGNGLIKCAAGHYYGGGNWKKYVGSYGAWVADRASDLQDQIDIITSSTASNPADSTNG